MQKGPCIQLNGGRGGYKYVLLATYYGNRKKCYCLPGGSNCIKDTVCENPPSDTTHVRSKKIKVGWGVGGVGGGGSDLHQGQFNYLPTIKLKGMSIVH